MKRCPTCNRVFSDPSLSFCIEDGTPLIAEDQTTDETTIVSPSSRQSSEEASPVQPYKPRDWQPSDYQPPAFQPAASTPKRSTWPWIVGIVAVVILGLALLGVAGAIILPGILKARSNASRGNTNVNGSSDYNPNLNTNPTNSNSDTGQANSNTEGNQNSNASDSEVTTPAPTDSDKVLSDLTALEHEWTAANINADTKKLDRILADDYVGSSSDGQIQGKAEYLRTIRRDTEIQKWDFENLKVTLRGDRATLTGVIRLQLKGGEVGYRFVDKFVWRDDRWQAVSSEVTRMSDDET